MQLTMHSPAPLKVGPRSSEEGQVLLVRDLPPIKLVTDGYCDLETDTLIAGFGVVNLDVVGGLCGEVPSDMTKWSAKRRYFSPLLRGLPVGSHMGASLERHVVNFLDNDAASLT